MSIKKIKGVNYRTSTVNEATINLLNQLRNAGLGKDAVPFYQHYLIGPASAQHVLDNFNTKNRTINKPTVEQYARMMRNDKWNGQNDDAITFDNEGNLINGQHRLMAIVSSETEQEFMFKFGVDPSVKYIEGTGRLKTAADNLAMNGKLEYRNERQAVARLVFGFLYDQSRPFVYSNNVKVSNLDLGEIEEIYGDAILESLLFVMATSIRNVTVTSNAAFLHFLLKQTEHKDKADQFITAMATGINMGATDPRLLVRNKLIADSLGKKEFRTNSNKKDACLGLFVKAWNSWIEGKDWKGRPQTPVGMPRIHGLTAVGSHKVYVNAD